MIGKVPKMQSAVPPPEQSKQCSSGGQGIAGGWLHLSDPKGQQANPGGSVNLIGLLPT